MVADLRVLFSLAFVFVGGLVFNVVACTVYLSDAVAPNFLPLAVVVCYVAAPCPGALCVRSSAARTNDAPGGSVRTDVGHFLTGALIAGGLCFPGVLAHAGLISLPAAALSAIGGLTVYGAVAAFQYHFRSDDGGAPLVTSRP